ncbi:MAG: hypothetical protein RLZZ111_2315 [Planctomycetota bacterium]
MVGRAQERAQRENDAGVTLVPLGTTAMSAAAAVPVVEAQQVTDGTTTVSCQTTRLPLVVQQVRQPLSTQVTVAGAQAGAQTVSHTGAQRTGSQQTGS